MRMASGSSDNITRSAGYRGRSASIAGDPGVVVDIARSGDPHDRVDEEVGVELLGGAQGQLLVRPVHGVPGVERHDPVPAQPVELGPQLPGCATELGELVVGWHPDPLDGATDVDGVGLLEVRDAGVAVFVGAEDRVGLAGPDPVGTGRRW